MKKMGDLLEEFLSSGELYYRQNVISGHTKVKVNWKLTIFTAFLGHVAQKKVLYYFFCFDDEGIYVRQYENMNFITDTVFIPWSDIFDFRYKNGLVEVEIDFTYNEKRFQFMLAKRAHSEPWMSENIENLIENNFYKPAF